jgi:hypothetical protein
LQKEIKRLQDDNRFLLGENQRLQANQRSGSAASLDKSTDELAKELSILKERMKTDKDKHQQEIISLSNNYNQKLNSMLDNHRLEVEKLSRESAKNRDDGWKDDGWSTLGKSVSFLVV